MGLGFPDFATDCITLDQITIKGVFLFHVVKFNVYVLMFAGTEKLGLVIQ